MTENPATLPTTSRHILALGAGVLMNMVFGSLYAWSVFIPGLEQEFTVLRADVSIVFSLAVISFTAGNFLVPFVFGRLPTALLPLLSAGLAGAGLALAGMGSGYQTIVFGFGVLFGLGCGIAYNTSLQTAQFALPNKPGLANGIIISSFAVGSILAANLLSDSIAVTGVRATFWMLALSVIAVGSVSVVLLALSSVKLPRQDRARGPSPDTRHFLDWIFSRRVRGHNGNRPCCGHRFTLRRTGSAGRDRRCRAWDRQCGRSAILGLAERSHLGPLRRRTRAFDQRHWLGRRPRQSYRRRGCRHLSHGGHRVWDDGYSFDITSDYRVALEFAAVASVLGLFNAMRLPRQNPTA